MIAKSSINWYQHYFSFCEIPLLFIDSAFDTIAVFPFNKFLKDVHINDFKGFKIDKQLRLGQQQERFFSWYTAFSSDLELLLENKQIIQENKTIGELDFVLKQLSNDCLWHVELVTKIYLYDYNPEFHTYENWIGPNRNDCLDKKMKKLWDKQFPLLYHHETKAQLYSSNTIKVDLLQQSLCFKAFLFVPYIDFNQDTVPLSGFNKECVKGFWIRFNDFTANNFGRDLYILPQKLDWFLDPSFGQDWNSFESIKTAVITTLAEKRSPMCWRRTNNGIYERFFIVWWD